MDTREVFKKNLTHLLKETGWSQYQLAKKTKIAQPQLARYIAGENFPSAEALDAIAEAFAVTVAELFKSDEVPTSRIEVQKLPKDVVEVITQSLEKSLNRPKVPDSGEGLSSSELILEIVEKLSLLPEPAQRSYNRILDKTLVAEGIKYEPKKARKKSG